MYLKINGIPSIGHRNPPKIIDGKNIEITVIFATEKLSLNNETKKPITVPVIANKSNKIPAVKLKLSSV